MPHFHVASEKRDDPSSDGLPYIAGHVRAVRARVKSVDEDHAPREDRGAHRVKDHRPSGRLPDPFLEGDEGQRKNQVEVLFHRQRPVDTGSGWLTRGTVGDQPVVEDVERLRDDRRRRETKGKNADRGRSRREGQRQIERR